MSSDFSGAQIKEWLKSRSIDPKEAKSLLCQVTQQYPFLGKQIKKNRDVHAELELVQLVYDIQNKRFPLRAIDRRQRV